MIETRKIALLFILGLLIGCNKAATPEAGSPDEKAAVAVELTIVKSQAVLQHLDLDGSFGPNQGGLARVTAATSGRARDVLVKEGDRVRKGQLLARLDPKVQNAQQASALAASQSAQIQIGQSKTAYEASKLEQENSVVSAQLALKQAIAESRNGIAQAQFTLQQTKSDLDRIKNGARPLELAQAHETTIQAQVAKSRAQTEYDRDQTLWSQGNIAKRQFDDARTALETAASALAAAQDSEGLLKAGARPEEVSAAESRFAAAQEALSSARRLGTVQVSSAQTALAHAKSGYVQLKNKQADIANAQSVAAQKAADLAATAAAGELLEVKAPFDGRIIRRSVTVGEQIDAATPIFTIAKAGVKSDFVASAIPDQAQEIGVGMQASIDAGGATLHGRVIDISPPDSSSNLATVRMSVEGSPASGSFGTAHIVLRRLPECLVVPDGSIVQKDGKNAVFRNVDGVAKLTEVEVGPEQNGVTAILSGLHFGNSIVASGGNELDDGAKITSADKRDADKKDEKKGDEKKESGP